MTKTAYIAVKIGKLLENLDPEQKMSVLEFCLDIAESEHKLAEKARMNLELEKMKASLGQPQMGMDMLRGADQ